MSTNRRTILVTGGSGLVGRGIQEALKKLFSPEFQRNLKTVINPYGNGGASEAIVTHIERLRLGDDLLVKRFHDLR